MKKLIIFILIPGILFYFTGCRNNDEIQGVSVLDSGEVSVTFTVPDGMTVEDVLGSEIGEEHTVCITNANSSTQENFTHWYTVSAGGILSRFDDIYRYGPDAEISQATGTATPQTWVMLYSAPSDDEIFKPEDTDLLAEKYGIHLYFDGDAPNSNIKSNGVSYNASDYTFSEVSRWCTGFNDGYCFVMASSKDEQGSHGFILSSDGTMAESPSCAISNFYSGAALAHVGMDDSDYADSIIDPKGNVIWSIRKEGAEAAKQYFPKEEVTKVQSPFCVDKDTYHGYFPVEFSIDSFDYTGSSIGILNAKGEWIVEPTAQSRSVSCDLADYFIAADTFIFDYASDKATYFDGNANTDSDIEEKRQRLIDNLTEKGYLAEHDGLIYKNSLQNAAGFYDEHGNLIIDLSKYNLADSPEFTDGYALLAIHNQQRSSYLTIIDTSGKEMFKPLKDNGHGDLSEGIFFMEDENGGYFMNVNGEKVGNLTGENHLPCHDGRAWIETADGWVCIDSQGNKVF